LQLAEGTTLFSICLQMCRREEDVIANLEGVLSSMLVSILGLTILSCVEGVFGHHYGVLPLNKEVFCGCD
jgi:hypothetical protein